MLACSVFRAPHHRHERARRSPHPVRSLHSGVIMFHDRITLLYNIRTPQHDRVAPLCDNNRRSRCGRSPQCNMITPLHDMITPHWNMITPQCNMITPLHDMITPQRNLITPLHDMIAPQCNIRAFVVPGWNGCATG